MGCMSVSKVNPTCRIDCDFTNDDQKLLQRNTPLLTSAQVGWSYLRSICSLFLIRTSSIFLRRSIIEGLHCPWLCTKNFRQSSHIVPRAHLTVSIVNVTDEKLRNRETESPAWGHTARKGQGLHLNPDLTPKTVIFNDCSIYFPADKSGKSQNYPQFIGNIQISNRRHTGCHEIWTTISYFPISDITSLVFPEAVTAHRYQISQLFSLPKYLLNLQSFLLFDKSWSRPLAKLLLYLLLPLKQVKVESKWVSREKTEHTLKFSLRINPMSFA